TTGRRIVDFGSPHADLQQGSAINDRNQRARDATRLRGYPLGGKKREFAGSPQTNSLTNVFDVTRDLVIRHHTDLDLIERLVVMKCGIPVTGEATTYDRAEDVGVAC